MIDFVKIQVIDPHIQKLLAHKNLDFKIELNEETAEINSYFKTAIHRHLKFQIVDGKHLNISGSLHKFRNHGINHDDFTFTELKKTIEYLQYNFGINPGKTFLRNLEFGVNITTQKDPNWYLTRMINYKGNAFSKMKARNRNIGLHCYLQQYGIKIYNKGFQCNLEENRLRYEVKVTRMAYLKNNGITLLNDLMSKDKLIVLGKILTESFDQILMFDPGIELSLLNDSDKEIYLIGKNPLSWEYLTRKKDHSYYSLKSSFKSICDRFGNTQHFMLANLIEEKWMKLLRT